MTFFGKVQQLKVCVEMESFGFDSSIFLLYICKS